MAFLISPMGLPLAAIWLLGKVQSLKFAILDSNDTVFKYNKKANVYSMIEADYLMKNYMEGKNLFLFLSNARDDSYFCRSFFPEEKMDYTKNQASWTLLYKKKRNLIDGSEHILYDRLKKDVK